MRTIVAIGAPGGEIAARALGKVASLD